VRVNKWFLPVLALLLLLGTVGVAQASGWWLVSGREMVNLEQLAGGSDVKGWMTLQQVADGSGMTVESLYTRLGLPADIPPQTALKELEGVVEGFETSTVRTVVDAALGLTPASAAEEVLQEETLPAAVQPAATVPPAAAATPDGAPPAAATPAAATPAPTATVAHTPLGEGAGSSAGLGESSGEGEARPSVSSAATIKGSHTLQEIVDATGVELPALLAALALPAETDPHTAVRQLVADGLLVEVEQVRTAVAALE
jgi:hypothetical protein